MYLNIDKEKIRFVNYMNPEGLEEEFQQKAGEFSDMLGKWILGCNLLHHGNRTLLILAILNLILNCSIKEYREGLWSLICAGLLLFITVAIRIINNHLIHKIETATEADRFFNTAEAKRKIETWQSIMLKISKPSTRLDFSINNGGKVTINTFWVDDKKKAHNDIFCIPIEKVKQTQDENVIIELVNPLENRDYISLYLPVQNHI